MKKLTHYGCSVSEIFVRLLLLLKRDKSFMFSQRNMSSFGLEDEVIEFVSDMNTR